ncbi:MAG: tetratricopeptide (TPR) repeat protein [Yoonia sp.]|jgi:tetratricopeptide (TPR) repeat protein
MKWIIPLAVIAAPAVAEQCPTGPDHAARLDQIIVELGRTTGPQAASPLSQELWELWLDAPDPAAQAILDEGMAQRESFDFLGARDTLDGLVEYCPDYAEGYNQRAFASFLRRDYNAALVDLNKALEIMPNHIAALSGKGMTLMGMGRNEEGQEALRGALALNPWLAERALITEPAGTDI